MERKGNVKKGKTKIKKNDYLYLIRHLKIGNFSFSAYFHIYQM